MKYLTLILVLCAVCSGWAGDPPEGEEVKLTPRAEAAISVYEKELAQVAEVYRKAAEKARARALTVLRREMETQTRRGDLNAALALKAKIQELGNVVVTDILGNPIEEAAHPANAVAVTVVSARYGTGDKWVDASEYVRKSLKPGVKEYDYSQIHNKVGNPKPGEQKYVEVVYKLGDGEPKTKKLRQQVPFIFD